ncbi:NADP-dependent oxidoreductase [Streptomyces sp. NPDC058664]|uniref:NADP-dependent oxidoreductase n=1 Tax=unclassified Streptomyces TaxID=2593676 RepID=UPI00364FE905
MSSGTLHSERLSMRVIRIDEFGGPEVLRIGEAPDRERRSGEVLIRAVATSINPVDDKTREGAVGDGTPPLPMTLGWDLAGTVVDGGSSGLPAGASVLAMSHQLSTGRGTWADLVAMPAAAVALAPTTVSPLEAATLPLPGLSALQTLRWLAVSAGRRLLITGAGGAVGGLALQIARFRGVRADALVSRPEHIDWARRCGAEFVTADPGDLRDRAYDAVLDTFGAFVTDAVADGGRYASIATQAGPVPDLSQRRVHTTVHQVREDGAGIAELAGLVDRGALRLRTDSVFALREIQTAHRHFLRGGLKGKVVITF